MNGFCKSTVQLNANNLHHTNIYIALTLYAVTLAVSLSVCQGRSQWLVSTCNLDQGSHPGYGVYGYATS